MAITDLSTSNESAVVCAARECLYRFLSLALTDPRQAKRELLTTAENQRLASEAADLLRQEAITVPLGPGELEADGLDLAPVLAELTRPLSHARAEYDRVFGLVTPRECPPYETEYHRTTEAFFRSQQLADVAGFYRAFGVDLARSAPERPDHIAVEFEFMALLLTKKRLACALSHPAAEEHARVCEAASERFFIDHLVWWVPAFAKGLRRKAGTGFYAALSDPIAALIPIERAQFGVPAPSGFVWPEFIEKPEEQSGCTSCPMQP